MSTPTLSSYPWPMAPHHLVAPPPPPSPPSHQCSPAPPWHRPLSVHHHPPMLRCVALLLPRPTTRPLSHHSLALTTSIGCVHHSLASCTAPPRLTTHNLLPSLLGSMVMKPPTLKTKTPNLNPNNLDSSWWRRRGRCVGARRARGGEEGIRWDPFGREAKWW